MQPEVWTLDGNVAGPIGDGVLVVEDDATTRRAVVDYLTARAYRAHGCETLSEAAERLAVQRYACVITDLSLSTRESRDGLELVRLARARSIGRVILMTASDEAELDDTGRGAGADVVLRKPFGLKQLDAWLPARSD